MSRSPSLFNRSPEMMWTCQGWVLQFDGERCASSSTARSSASGTGSGLNARTEVRFCTVSWKDKVSATGRVEGSASDMGWDLREVETIRKRSVMR